MEIPASMPIYRHVDRVWGGRSTAVAFWATRSPRRHRWIDVAIGFPQVSRIARQFASAAETSGGKHKNLVSTYDRSEAGTERARPLFTKMLTTSSLSANSPGADCSWRTRLRQERREPDALAPRL